MHSRWKHMSHGVNLALPFTTTMRAGCVPKHAGPSRFQRTFDSIGILAGPLQLIGKESRTVVCHRSEKPFEINNGK